MVASFLPTPVPVPRWLPRTSPSKKDWWTLRRQNCDGLNAEVAMPEFGKNAKFASRKKHPVTSSQESSRSREASFGENLRVSESRVEQSAFNIRCFWETVNLFDCACYVLCWGLSPRLLRYCDVNINILFLSLGLFDVFWVKLLIVACTEV